MDLDPQEAERLFSIRMRHRLLKCARLINSVFRLILSLFLPTATEECIEKCCLIFLIRL